MAQEDPPHRPGTAVLPRAAVLDTAKLRRLGVDMTDKRCRDFATDPYVIIIYNTANSSQAGSPPPAARGLKAAP